MDYYETIASNFQHTIETVALSADALAAPIERSAGLMASALLSDRKIISCGNGPDAALAQLFTSYLLGVYRQERPALPAFTLGADSASLTGITQANGSNDVYSRQLRALAQPGDVVLVISSSEPADNLSRAMQAAHERNAQLVLLSNQASDDLASLVRAEDVEIRVDTDNNTRAVEIYTMAIHSICTLIELGLFGAHQE